MIALLFAVGIDAVLFLCCYWTELISSAVRLVLLLAFVVFWILLACVSGFCSQKIKRRLEQDATGDRFLEAITHYLHGNWFEAEYCLKKLIRQNSQDAEALLMIATMFRHIQRYNEADEMLRELERQETSAPWYYEILLEKKALRRERTEVLAQSRMRTLQNETPEQPAVIKMQSSSPEEEGIEIKKNHA